MDEPTRGEMRELAALILAALAGTAADGEEAAAAAAVLVPDGGRRETGRPAPAAGTDAEAGPSQRPGAAETGYLSLRRVPPEPGDIRAERARTPRTEGDTRPAGDVLRDAAGTAARPAGGDGDMLDLISERLRRDSRRYDAPLEKF